MEGSEHEQEKIERLRRAMYSRSLSDKLKDRPRRVLDEQRPIVGDDFVHVEEQVAGSTVAPRAIGLARAALWWLLLGAIVFCIAAVGFFAYYFTLGAGGSAVSPGNIDISVSGPPQVEGGVPTELQIVVSNRNNVALQLAELVITYPDGTRSPTDFTTELPHQRISLGSIEAGGTRQGTVSAVFAGDEGTHASVKVELEYRISGSSAVFASSSEYNLVFSTSPLSVAVDGNTDTISGQPVEFTITVASNAHAPVTDVLLSAQYPFGFKFTSATPAPAVSDSSAPTGLWELGTLSPGQRRTITVRGTLSGEQGNSRVFHFTAGTRSSPQSKTVETPLSEQVFTMAISKPFLGLGVLVNGVSGKSAVVAPGNNVNINVTWQNNLPTAITNAVIVARLSGVQIDGATVHSTDGFYRSSDGVVIWDKTTNAGFAELAPGARGTVGFSFQMPSSDVLKGLQNPRLDISINAAGNRLSETGVPQNLQATANQKISVASELQLDARGLYYSNPFGSTGPMPPKAGAETTYAIVFTVTNTTSKITDAKITATLPSYVRWVGIYSPPVEKVYFKGTSGEKPPANSACQGFTADLCWDLGDIETGAGLGGNQPRQAAVAIGLEPSTSQIGQEPILIQDIALWGIDESKAEALRAANPGATIVPVKLKSAPNVTTNILGDQGFSAANATVVK